LASVLDLSRRSKPHLIVIDGISQLWESVKDWGTANAVASSAGSYWYAVNERWTELVAQLRRHDGPVLLLGRRDVDGGLIGHRDLADDVDVLIELEPCDAPTYADVRAQQAVITAPRMAPPLDEVSRDYEIESVLRRLNIAEVNGE